MKKYWVKISTRIDAMTLRDRALLFGLAAGFVIFVMFFFGLNPSYQKQRMMLDSMAQQQDRIAGVDAEITATIEAHTIDPDAAERARLAKMRADAQALATALTALQDGMVAPERMTGMLEQLLRSHRGLHLKSLRTLGESSVSSLAPAAAAVAATPGAPATVPPPDLLHRHGVQMVVQGNYADMVAYMDALERMQSQVFWGEASLKADKYPAATLTVVVYTINLDKKWLKL
jgi:MSHA biogenesis protein MshJ